MASGTPSSNALQHTWVIWEHKVLPKGDDYKNSMKEICEFGSLEEFWKYWAYFPKPSDVFFDGGTRKEVAGRTIEAFSVFKKNIKPEWEDPENRNGAELSCRAAFSLNDVDRFWENMVFGLIGEVIDINDEICGCRVIDKSKKGNPKTMFKFELWLRSENSDHEKIKKNLLDCLFDGDSSKIKGLPEFEFKLHNLTGGGARK